MDIYQRIEKMHQAFSIVLSRVKQIANDRGGHAVFSRQISDTKSIAVDSKFHQYDDTLEKFTSGLLLRKSIIQMVTSLPGDRRNRVYVALANSASKIKLIEEALKQHGYQPKKPGISGQHGAQIKFLQELTIEVDAEPREGYEFRPPSVANNYDLYIHLLYCLIHMVTQMQWGNVKKKSIK